MPGRSFEYFGGFVFQLAPRLRFSLAKLREGFAEQALLLLINCLQSPCIRTASLILLRETFFQGAALIESPDCLQRQLPSVRKFHRIPITLFIHSVH
jgi:hypothetical protein